MRRFLLFAGVCAALGFDVLPASAQTAVMAEYGFYRFYALRRHNDIQGVEAVFDDYRRNWLKRYNSEILVGSTPNKHVSDTPHCSHVDELDSGRMNRANCGSGHVFRSNLVGFTAENRSETDETGVLAYLGYEHLVSEDLFLGLGFGYGTSQIDHASAGSTLDVETTDLAVHLLGGYRFENQSMAAWNVSYVDATDDVTRDGNITGSFDSHALLVTGVWYKNWDLTPDRHVSLGIDYTLLNYETEGFIDSSGQKQKVPIQWRGDFTTSLLFTQDYDNGEVFARFGTSFEALRTSAQQLDFTFDLGGSLKVSDGLAVTGSVGTMLREAGFFELHGSSRLLAKF